MAGLIASVFAVGAVCHGVDALLPFMLASTPWMQAAFGSYILFTAHKDQGFPIAVWAFAAAAATFFVEALGVATGLVFGAYSYGDVLGVKILGVPPLIGFNWVVVVLGLARFVRRRFPPLNPAVAALFTAAAAAAFDWALEPLAIALGYWTWAGGDVPLKNYAAWFLIAYACALPTFFFPRKPFSALPSVYVLAQLGFFVLTRFILSVA